MTKDFIYGKKTSNTAYTSKNFGQNVAPELSNIVLRLFDGSNQDMSLVAFVTGFTMSCAVGEVVQAELTFEGHGAPLEMGMIA